MNAKKTRIALYVSMALGLTYAGPMLAGDMSHNDMSKDRMSSDTSAMSSDAGTKSSDELKSAKETVRGAAKVVDKITSDPKASHLLEQARAAFIVPDYGRASLIVGGAGGRGVLITRTDNGWSAPAFYNVGSINFGAAAGAEGGSVAYLIMSNDALKGFKEDHNFALNADAGYTIVNYSGREQTSIGKGTDIVVWSDMKGLYGDFATSVSDIFWDKGANNAYYHQPVTISQILDGSVKDPMSQSPLRSEFSAFETREGSQGSGSGSSGMSQ